jgi:hypothetical protein
MSHVCAWEVRFIQGEGFQVSLQPEEEAVALLWMALNEEEPIGPHWRDCGCGRFRPSCEPQCECGNMAFWARSLSEAPYTGFVRSRGAPGGPVAAASQTRAKQMPGPMGASRSYKLCKAVQSFSSMGAISSVPDSTDSVSFGCAGAYRGQLLCYIYIIIHYYYIYIIYIYIYIYQH